MAEVWDERQLAADGFEHVYAELDWYDGPRNGLVDIGGVPHYLQCHDVDLFVAPDEYFVWSADEKPAALEREQWAVFVVPRSWTQDRERCRAAGIPGNVGSRPSPPSPRDDRRGLDAGVSAAWVTGDEVYGSDPHLSAELERRQVGYVLAVSRKRTIATRVGGTDRGRRESLHPALARMDRRHHPALPGRLRLPADRIHRLPPTRQVQAPVRGSAARPAEDARPQDRRARRLLFAHRARLFAKPYINLTVIPVLCRKAGVPTTDVLGQITSRWARSTIATRLYNAKEPMTLFELQAWLGHRSPETTQHYTKIAPTTLAKAYGDTGYVARNVRTVEILIDRDAVASGAAASGEPWQHYDLGHGYCAYTFFEQCPHRMPCARCDFYTPKGSSKAQLLEAKENLQRMLGSIPLTADEQAAVKDGQAALGRLLGRLTDVPSPAGPTPRETGVRTIVTLLPIVGTTNAACESAADRACGGACTSCE